MPACDSAGRRTALRIGTGRAFQGWPLTSKLELGAFASAVPCARLHARLVLLEWGLGHVVQDAELLVSELTTNAIQASRHPITMFLNSDRRVLVIEVWDDLPDVPAPQPHAIDAESGVAWSWSPLLVIAGGSSIPGAEGRSYGLTCGSPLTYLPASGLITNN